MGLWKLCMDPKSSKKSIKLNFGIGSFNSGKKHFLVAKTESFEEKCKLTRLTEGKPYLFIALE